MFKLPGFVKNVATLASGSMIASLIAVVSIPVISRLFEPTDFGSAALFVSIVTVLAILSTLRYEHAIVLPDDDIEAFSIVTMSVNVAVVMSLFIAIVFGSAYYLFPEMPWIEQLGVWFLILPAAVFLLSLINIFVSYNTRLKEFKSVAVSEVGNASVMSVGRILFGLVSGSSVAGLIISILLGYGFRLFLLSRKFYTKIFSNVFVVDKNATKLQLYKYRQFPKYSMPTGVLMSIGRNMPIFLLALMFTNSVVGLYAMAQRLMQLPVMLISESVRRTYMQKAADINNQGASLMPTLIKTTIILALIAVLLFLPIIIWGKEIFTLVLGDKWGASGVYVAILSPWFASMFVQSTPSVTYIIFQRQDILLKIHIATTVLMSAIFVLVGQLNATPEQALLAISILGTISNLLIAEEGFRLANKKTCNEIT